MRLVQISAIFLTVLSASALAAPLSVKNLVQMSGDVGDCRVDIQIVPHSNPEKAVVKISTLKKTGQLPFTVIYKPNDPDTRNEGGKYEQLKFTSNDVRYLSADYENFRAVLLIDPTTRKIVGVHAVQTDVKPIDFNYRKDENSFYCGKKFDDSYFTYTPLMDEPISHDFNQVADEVKKFVPAVKSFGRCGIPIVEFPFVEISGALTGNNSCAPAAPAR